MATIDDATMRALRTIIQQELSNATSVQAAAQAIAKGVTQYIGARYVPLFANPIQWDNTREYEPLTIVLYQGNSYTTRQFTPAGIDITNEAFWAETGNYNAQIEQYRQEVLNYKQDVDSLRDEVAYSFDTVSDMKAATNLSTGMTVHTNGFHSINDGGAAFYRIGDNGNINEMDVIACQDTLVATLILPEIVTPEILGVNNANATPVLSRMFELKSKVYAFKPNTTYNVVGGIYIGNGNIVINGNGATLNNTRTNANDWVDATAYLMHSYEKADINTASTLKLIDLTFNGNFSNSINIGTKTSSDYPFEYGTLLKINAFDSVVIENCFFIDSMQDGVSFSGCKNVVVDNCDFQSIGCTEIGAYNYGGTNNAVTYYGYYQGNAGNVYANCETFRFTNNKVNTVRDECLRVDQCALAIIEGNYAYNIQQHFIESFTYNAETMKCVVKNNKVNYLKAGFYSIQDVIKCTLQAIINSNTVINAGNSIANYTINRGETNFFGYDGVGNGNHVIIVGNNYYELSDNADTGYILFTNTAYLKCIENTFKGNSEIAGAFRLINTVAHIDGNFVNLNENNALFTRINKDISIVNNLFKNVSLKGQIIKFDGVKNVKISGNTFESYNRVINIDNTDDNSFVIISENTAKDCNNFIYAESAMYALYMINNITNVPKGTFNTGAIGSHAVETNNVFA